MVDSGSQSVARMPKPKASKLRTGLAKRKQRLGFDMSRGSPYLPGLLASLTPVEYLSPTWQSRLSAQAAPRHLVGSTP